MKGFLLCILATVMMFSNGQSYSESSSCSTVNGHTVCESQKSRGNVAGASSAALINNGGSFQGVDAMTAGGGETQYSSQTLNGNGYGGGQSTYFETRGPVGPVQPPFGVRIPMGPGIPMQQPIGFNPFLAVGLPNPMGMLGGVGGVGVGVGGFGGGALDGGFGRFGGAYAFAGRR